MLVTTLLLSLAPGQDLLPGQALGEPPTRYPRVDDLRGPERWVHDDKTGRSPKRLLVGAHHPDAGSALVWQDLREGHAGLYFQRFDAEGQRIGTDRSVQSHRTTRLRLPSVALAADGSGLVAWVLPLGGRDGVRVRFFGPDGEWGSEGWVEPRGERAQGASPINAVTVATDPTGSMVVFRDDRGVHVRRYDPAGKARRELETLLGIRTVGSIEARFLGGVPQVAFTHDGIRSVAEGLGGWREISLGWRLPAGSSQTAVDGGLTLGKLRVTTEDGEVLLARGRRGSQRVATDEASARQDRLALAHDPRGGALLVWEDERNGVPELWWRRASLDGTCAPEQVLVAEGRPRWAAAAVHASGAAFVVWKEAEGALLGATLDAAGKRGAAVPLDLDQVVGSADPAAVVAVPTGFLVVWSRAGGGLFARMVDVHGKGQRLKKLARTSSICARADLAAYGDGRVLVAWDEVVGRGDDPRVQVAVLDQEGALVGRPIAPRLPRGAGWDPSVAIDAEGQALVAFCSGQLGDRNRDVLAQRLDRRARPQAGLVPITTYLREQDYPEVAALESGGFVVAWEDDISGHDHTYLRRLGSDGALGPVRTLDPGLTEGAETCTRPLVIPAGDGLLCAWGDRRRARHLDLVLLPLGPAFDG